MWPTLIPVLTSLLDKIFPDPTAAANAKLELIKLQQAGDLKVLDADLQIALAQAGINQAEAQSTDNFRGGWRPGAGWICVFGLGYQFILQPLLPWVLSIAGATVPPLPAIDNETLMTLLMGMLGLGGLRTFERVKGKA